VKYGNKDKMCDGEKGCWTQEIDVKGTIMCNNSLGSPVGGVKECMCRPRKLAVDAKNKSTIKRASFPACEGNVAALNAGYAVPKCIIAKVEPVMQAQGITVTAGMLYSMGIDSAGFNFMLGMLTFDEWLGVNHTTIVEGTTSQSALGTYRVPCDGEDGRPTAAECIAKIDKDVMDPTTVANITRRSIESVGIRMVSHDLYMVKDLLEWKFLPSSFPDAPTELPEGMTCPKQAPKTTMKPIGTVAPTTTTTMAPRRKATGKFAAMMSADDVKSFGLSTTEVNATKKSAAVEALAAATASAMSLSVSSVTITNVTVAGVLVYNSSRRLAEDIAVKVGYVVETILPIKAPTAADLKDSIQAEATKIDKNIVVKDVPTDELQQTEPVVVTLAGYEKTKTGAAIRSQQSLVALLWIFVMIAAARFF